MNYFLKIITTASGIIFLVLFACNDKQVEEITKTTGIEYLDYDSPEHQLKISYPIGWDTTNRDSRMILTVVEEKTSKQDTFRENIVLYKTHLPVKMTLDSVLQLALSTMSQQYPDGKLMYKRIAKNGVGKDYAAFEMVSPQQGINIASRVYYFPIGTDFYILNLGYDIKDSARYHPIYESVFNSLIFN
jgi:hypothetical protein